MSFSFIDLFAGIGGFHMALSSVGGECVFASEFDKFAAKTYEYNHKLKPFGDIKDVNITSIPDFDVLCAGFPCQPFSKAGKKQGLSDARGTLFFNIAQIISEKQPKAFILENVRGLLTHDDSKTFNIIHDILDNKLGYKVFYKVIKASDFGLPQLRPRLFIVGIRQDYYSSFNFPSPIPLRYTMSDVFQGECTREIGFTLRVGGRKSGVNDRRNWDGYIVDGKERFLTPKEALIMQGFPDSFSFPSDISDSRAMKLIGNSIAIPIVENIMIEILKTLNNSET